jgi:transcriptional repressor NrdR
MRCPFCQSRDSRVMDSRANDDGIRRRRQCTHCGERFTTHEFVQQSVVQVVKRDERREPFMREKLVAGLRKACDKRSVSVAQLEVVASDIEAAILAEGRAEVSSTRIGELAMEGLRHLDHIAYIRFASVYRPFADLASLKEAVLALEAGPAVPPSLQLTLPGTEEREPAPVVRELPPRIAIVGARR